MKILPQHTVKSQTYDVSLEDEDIALKIQSSISRLHRDRVEQIIQDVLDSYASQYHHYEFDSIELDLGVVSMENYENELVIKIESKLNEYLASVISANGSLREGKKIVTLDLKLEQFAFFLKNGHAPWNSSTTRNPLQLLEELIRKHPTALRELLYQLGKQSEIRKRIIYQYHDKTLEQLITLVSPAESEYMIGYKDIMILENKRNPITKKSVREFRNAVWEILLSYSFEDSTGYFNKKAFLNALIHKTAAKFNIEYSNLLDELIRGMKQSIPFEHNVSQFRLILIELEADNLKNQRSSLSASEQLAPNFSLFYESLDYYFKTGIIPKNSAAFSSEELSKRLIVLLKTHREISVQYLLTWIYDSTQKNRLLEFATPQLLTQLMKLSPKSITNTLDDFIKILTNTYSDLTAESNKLLQWIRVERNRLTLLFTTSNGVTDQVVIQYLLEYILIEQPLDQDEYLEMLQSFKMKSPSNWQVHIDKQLQELTHDNLETFWAQSIRKITRIMSKTSVNTWSYWMEIQLRSWLPQTRLTRSDFLQQLNKHSLKSGLLEHQQTMIVALIDLIKSPSNERLQQLSLEQSKRVNTHATWLSKKQNIFYAITNGMLPWWPSLYHSATFNTEFEALWNHPTYKVELLQHLKSQGFQPNLYQLLSKKNLKAIGSELNVVNKSTQFQLFEKTDLFFRTFLIPMGLLTSSDREHFKHRMFQLMLLNNIPDVLYFVENQINHWIQIVDSSKSFDVQFQFRKELQKQVISYTPKAFQKQMDVVFESKDHEEVTSELHWVETDTLLAFLKRNDLSAPSEGSTQENVYLALMEVLNDKPQIVVSWLRMSEFRQAVIDNLDRDEVEQFVGTALNMNQQRQLRAVLNILFTLQDKISVAQFAIIRNQFFHTVLIRWSTGKIKALTIDEFAAILLKVFKDEVGVSKTEEIIFNTKSLVSRTSEEVTKIMDEMFRLGSKPKMHKLMAKKDEKYKKLGEKKERNFADALFITHAGLVIVAPYLGMLFSRLNYLKDNQFLSIDFRARAVILMAYIASGTTEPLEHELVLHKILCGMSIDHPIDVSIVLSSEEKSMANDMLDAIISHWTVLKNTSKEGLRVSFIDREGKLDEDANGFYLKVEQKSIDVLLDSIPWNIQKIKLSWMHKILDVIWR